MAVTLDVQMQRRNKKKTDLIGFYIFYERMRNVDNLGKFQEDKEVD